MHPNSEPQSFFGANNFPRSQQLKWQLWRIHDGEHQWLGSLVLSVLGGSGLW